jgi:hypothetical protein
MYEDTLKESTHKGFKYIIHRNDFGFKIAHIFLNKFHPWFKKHYDNIDSKYDLTYSSMENNEWVIGFDHGHIFDLPDPGYKYPNYPYLLITSIHQTVKSLEYVDEECKELCEEAYTVYIKHRRIIMIFRLSFIVICMLLIIAFPFKLTWQQRLIASTIFLIFYWIASIYDTANNQLKDE